MDYKDIFPLILTKPILGRLNILFFEDKLLNIPNVFHWLHILVLFQTPIISFPTTSVLGLITWCIGYSLMSKPSRANCLLWSDMAMAVSEKKKVSLVGPNPITIPSLPLPTSTARVSGIGWAATTAEGRLAVP